MTFIELIFYALFCLTVAATIALMAARLEIKHRNKSKKEKRK